MDYESPCNYVRFAAGNPSTIALGSNEGGMEGAAPTTFPMLGSVSKERSEKGNGRLSHGCLV